MADQERSDFYAVFTMILHVLKLLSVNNFAAWAHMGVKSTTGA